MLYVIYRVKDIQKNNARSIQISIISLYEKIVFLIYKNKKFKIFNYLSFHQYIIYILPTSILPNLYLTNFSNFYYIKSLKMNLEPLMNQILQTPPKKSRN